MNLLDALLFGAKAFIQGAVSAVGAVIREVLKEVDQSTAGRAATRLMDGFADRHFGRARELAEEERHLADKAVRDGRRSSADSDRLKEITSERDELRTNFERANAEQAAQDFKKRAGEARIARLDDDELSSSVGIVAAKRCPTCGGTMRVRQGDMDSKTEKRSFYWQCTEPNLYQCPTVKLDPENERANVIRPADLDLDVPKTERRAIWNHPDVIAETHGRVRQHLGDDDDKQITCPTHLLPLKLLQKRHHGGLVLDSYEYVCLGVMPNGRACKHTLALETMPQVAALLRRTEGDGIIRS